MENYHSSVPEMWKRFITSFPQYENCKYKAWYFCDNKKCADELAELVKNGIKKATTTLLYWFDKDKESLPESGDLNIVTNWEGIAQCIIKTTKVSVLPFSEVNAEMAATEGEGDKTLEYWRNAHIRFFTRDLEKENINFTEDMMVVFEEFELIYEDF